MRGSVDLRWPVQTLGGLCERLCWHTMLAMQIVDPQAGRAHVEKRRQRFNIPRQSRERTLELRVNAQRAPSFACCAPLRELSS
jgi:hypothetical protein